MVFDWPVIQPWQVGDVSITLLSDYFKVVSALDFEISDAFVDHYIYCGYEMHFHPWKKKLDMKNYIIELIFLKYFKRKCTYVNPYKHLGITKMLILFRFKGNIAITDFDSNIDFLRRSKQYHINLPFIIEILNSFKYPFNKAFINLIMNDYVRNEYYWYFLFRSYTEPYPYNVVFNILLEDLEPSNFNLFGKFGLPSFWIFANGHSKINWLIFRQSDIRTLFHVFCLPEYTYSFDFDTESYLEDFDYYFNLYANIFYLKFNSLLTHNFEFSFIFMGLWFFFIVYLFHSSILENLTHSFIFNKLNTSNFFFIKYKNFIEVFKKNRRRRGLKRIYFRFYRMNFCKKLCWTFKNFFTVSMYLKKMGYEPGFFPAYKEIWKD